MTNLSGANLNNGAAVGPQGEGMDSPSSFPSYPTYKDSGVEWLGVVPENWTLGSLKHLAWIRNGRDYKEVESPDGEYPVIGSGGQFANATRYLYDGESVLLGRKGTIDKPLYIHGRFWTVDTMFYTEVAAGASAKFLYYNALTIPFQYYSTSTALPSMTQGDLLNHPCAIPALEEQTQIARFLDRETARIDALIEEQQRLIELLKEKRQAMISHAVTKGLDPTVPMKYSGVEWLGEVPAHWAIKRLKQLVLDAAGIQMGPFGGMLVDLDDSDTGYKVYGQENTISGNFSSGNRWVPESRYFALSNYHLEVGDIVLTRKGSLGNCRRVSLLPQAGIIDSDTIRVRVQDQIMNPDYLELLLHEAGYISTQLSLVKRGAILSGLNSEIIANLVIVVPPPDGQEELLLEIKAASSKFDQGISDCEYAVGLLRERRSALISATVTGKIDVRGWQPPASASTPELEQEAV